MSSGHHMVMINSSVTLELEKDGQKISIDLEEAKQIIHSLSRFVKSNEEDFKTTAQSHKNAGKSYQLVKQINSAQKIPHMSDAKRKEIFDHIGRQLSTKPRTLSNLLEGVSYVPNHLPHITKMLENHHNIDKKTIGKRTYYFLKRKA